MQQLRWLPDLPDWRTRLRALATAEDPWAQAVTLANARLDFTRTNALDDALRRRMDGAVPAGTGTRPVRLAILGSATLAHLHACIRVAGLRRNIHVATYENDYGQYLQELLDAHSGLHKFKPDAVLFAFDAYHLTQGLHAALTAADADAALADVLARIEQCWALAKTAFACPVMQQTVLDVFPAVMGSNEHRLPGSRSRFVTRLNAALRAAADAHGADLVAVDDAARR